MGKSIEQSISQIAAKNISEQLFSKAGAFGGFGDFFAKMFGGTGAGGAGGGAALGTASSTTALSFTATLIPAIEAAALSLSTLGAGSAASSGSSALSSLFRGAVDSGFGALAAGGDPPIGKWRSSGSMAPS